MCKSLQLKACVLNIECEYNYVARDELLDNVKDIIIHFHKNNTNIPTDSCNNDDIKYQCTIVILTLFLLICGVKNYTLNK